MIRVEAKAVLVRTFVMELTEPKARALLVALDAARSARAANGSKAMLDAMYGELSAALEKPVSVEHQEES